MTYRVDGSRRRYRYRTKSGRVLTDADIQALADEAERGYDVSEFRAVDPARLAEIRRMTAAGQQDQLRYETGRLVEAVLTALGIPRFASWLNARLSGGKTPKAPG